MLLSVGFGDIDGGVLVDLVKKLIIEQVQFFHFGVAFERGDNGDEVGSSRIGFELIKPVHDGAGVFKECE